MLRIFIRALLRLLYRVEIRGPLQSAERMLVVANHQSFLDAVLVWAYFPVELTWLVHTQIARVAFFRLCLTQARHLVVDTTSPLALKAAVGLVESGKPIIMFPEGRVTVTGRMMKIYEGPAFVAARTGATIIPIHIDGAVYARGFSRMSGDFPLQWFPKITLTINPPETIPLPEAPNGKTRRRLAGDALRRLMQRMMLNNRPRTTIFAAFLDAVERYGRGREMVEDATGQTFTYGKLIKAAFALARLVGRMTSEGETVGVLMPNVGATLALLLGFFATRRIPAMLNYTAGLDGMQSALIASRARVVIASRAFVERARLQNIVARLQGVRVVYLEDLRPTLTLADKIWLMGYAIWFPRRVMRPARPEDPALVIFTSGSEGKPKGVVLHHGALLANCAQVVAVIEFSCKDKFLSAMPMFHSFGMTGGFLLPILTGARIFIYPSPLHYRIVPEMAYDRDCTIMFATNTFLANYAKRANPYDFRSVRFVFAGAEKLTDEVRRLFSDKFGVRIIEGYGATECSPVVSANSPMANRNGTVGELVPGMEFKLEPVAGIEEGGLLHVKGPNVMLGYWRDSNPGLLEPPLSSFGEGWYNTGDIAAFDSDGFLRLLGRVKRFAKVAGEMVSLETVEKIAEAASPAKMHAVITRPDPGRGEMLVLYTQDSSLQRGQLQQKARELGAPDLAVPRRIVPIDKIPLLGNGKKDYTALQRIAEEAAASA
jgi:acyl-[acyl-carrier-protein]-phospholipid O-acyltransferase / long-chain-fatty-acid--[acyl-carrier-protein] ligase